MQRAPCTSLGLSSGLSKTPAPGTRTDRMKEQSADEQERDRLANAIEHLKRSNRELLTTLEEDGPEPIYTDAVTENVQVIARMEQVRSHTSR